MKHAYLIIAHNEFSVQEKLLRLLGAAVKENYRYVSGKNADLL